MRAFIKQEMQPNALYNLTTISMLPRPGLVPGRGFLIKYRIYLLWTTKKDTNYKLVSHSGADEGT